MNDEKITPASLIGDRKVDKVEFNDNMPQIDKINQAMNQPSPNQNYQPPQQPVQQQRHVQQEPVRNAYSSSQSAPTGNVEAKNTVRNMVNQQPQPKRTLEEGALKKHPVFQKLKKSFGLNKDKQHLLKITTDEGAEIEFTMTAYAEELTSWAYVDSNQRGQNQDQSFLIGWYELLQGCLAVVAIDGTPIYDVLSIRPTDSEATVLNNNAFNLPNSLRKKCALELASEIWEDTSLIGEKIFSFFSTKVLDANKFTSNLDEEFEKKERYVCPLDNCGEVFMAEPTYNDEGNENPFFCRVHGIHLVKALRKTEESNLPLV